MDSSQVDRVGSGREAGAAPAGGEARAGAAPAPAPARRVLLLEDDARLLLAYARKLRGAGYEVDEVRTLAAARRALAAARYDCLVLDRLVPGGDALELVAELHTEAEHPPMIVLSALSEDQQRIEGLEAGAIDYVSKPVNLDELALRVDRVIETVPKSSGEVQRIGAVVIDRCRAQVEIDGERVHLSARQYGVFDYLASRVGQIALLEDLMEHCWDTSSRSRVNPLCTQITRLRAAFRGYLSFRMVRGTGYMLDVVDPEPDGGPSD